MIKNYFLTAIRSLRKHLTYSIINIAGLSLGLTICLLLVSWITHELSYDRFHRNSDRLYRVSLEYGFGGQTSKISVSPTALLPTLQKNFGEVENGVRVCNPSHWDPFILQRGTNLFQEEKFFYADSTFFDVFSFPLLAGSTQTVLSEPNTVVLTQSMAKKYFGYEDPMGKTILVNGKTEYSVSGIMSDVPANSFLQFDFVGSFSSLPASKEQSWWSANYQTFVLVRPGTNVQALSEKTNNLITQEVADQLTSAGDYVKYNFNPLTDIHLKSDVREYTVTGSIQYVYIFGSIALLVLVIACINYINLATAKASDRAKEVGIRKVVGAQHRQLFFQFITESLILTTVALGVALLLARITLPLFNEVTGKNFTSSVFMNTQFIGFSIIAVVIIAITSGAYPAIAITSFNPVKVLKGNFKSSGKGIWLRQSLVTFQFGVSIILIVGTMVVVKQLQYIQSKDLGYTKENTIIFPLDQKTAEVFPQLKSEIMRKDIATFVGRATESPSKISGGYSLTIEGDQNDMGMSVTAMAVDHDFVPAFNMKILAGRNFTENDLLRVDRDTTYAFILNESALKELLIDPEKAIGLKVALNGRLGEITGIVKDFHFAPLQQKIAPLVLFTEESDLSFIFAKLKPGNIQEKLADLQTICKTIIPHRPFEYDFLDEQYAMLYKNEQRMGQISSIFSTLAIVIACLGLFGLVSFSAAQKTKEIGIRKVLGATVSSIIILIVKDFAKLVGLAILLGIPLAYWIMNYWLRDFAYKTDIGVAPIIISSVTCMVIAFTTAGIQALKTALVNPTKTLRSE